MTTTKAPSGNDRIVELRWIPVLAAVFVALLAVAITFALLQPAPPAGADRAATFEGLGGDFVLTSHEGEPVSLADFRGKVVLIYFGYSFCPDVCPIHLSLLTAALDQMPARARDQVQPLFISIDPERDTPEALAGYVRHFTPSLIGLTGSSEEIAAVAGTYAVGYSREDDPDMSEYLMAHTSAFFVIDPEGRMVDLLRPDMTPDQLASAIREHL